MAKYSKRRANGEGSMKKRVDGRFEYQVVIGYAADGSRLRKSFYGRSATEARNAYKSYLKTNPKPVERVSTLGEWAKNWLEIYKRGKIEDVTFYEYELIITKNIIPEIGGVKLTELRPAHIEKLMRSVGAMSGSRQRKVAFLIKAILKDAVKNRYCTENVADELKLPKAVRKEFEIFRLSEAQKLLTFEHRYAVIVKLLLLTGMRRGELLALSWRNVDFENKLIHVKQAMSSGKIKDYTKNRMDRVVPITPELQAVLDSIPKSGFTVLSDDGKPLTKDQYNYRVSKCIKDSGIEYRSGHKCRHTSITQMLKNGVPLAVVQAIHGHRDIQTTQAYLQINTGDILDNLYKINFNEVITEVKYDESP